MMLADSGKISNLFYTEEEMRAQIVHNNFYKIGRIEEKLFIMKNMLDNNFEKDIIMKILELNEEEYADYLANV